MQGDRDRRTKGIRTRLLTGVAVFVCSPVAGAAFAQTAPTVETPQDPLPAGAVYIDAGSATRTGDVVTAESSGGDRVFLRSDGNVLRGENLAYDLASGAASVSGRVEAISADGTVVYASHLEADRDLKAAVAVDFATRFENGASLMAATAVRRSENVNELNYAIFTPCPICDDDGPKTPSLSIQAEKVVQDEALRAVIYRNAVFRLGGVPVFYTPFFAHPDPTVERASGFLVPIFNYDEGRGFSLETPYLHVVSPSEDWLISPQINSEVTPLLNLQWRRRFASANILVRGGYTYERDFGDFDLNGDGDYESNVRFGDTEHRSYLLSHGEYDPEGTWRFGFTAERTSDKTLFDRYDIRDPYQDNGLYYGDRRRLISQIYAERQTERSYVSIAAFSLQSLRLDPRFSETDFRDAEGFKVFEDDDALPLVAPLVEARWEPQGIILGGRLRIKGSAVSLYRDGFVGSPILNPSIVPTDTTGLSGVDSRRVTGQAEWRRVYILPQGVRIEPFLDGRVDVYSVADLPPAIGVEGSETLSRTRASAGVDISYPLIKRTQRADIILEPVAQLSVSSTSALDPRIPNEDAQVIELDESSLFRMDRFSGYDLMEDGARLTAGGRATIRWSEGRSASLFVGRSYRADGEDAFRTTIPDAVNGALYDPTGLAASASDWVVQGSFSPSDRIRSWGHATLDGSGDIRRAEAAVDGRWGRRNLASVSYIVDRSNPLAGELNRNYEFVQLAAQQFVYRNWGVSVTGIADMERDVITRQELGLLFDDDCFRFEIGYRRDNTRVRPSGPSDGVYVMDRATCVEHDALRGAIASRRTAVRKSGRPMGLMRYSTGAALAAVLLAGSAYGQTAPVQPAPAAGAPNPAAGDGPATARPEPQFELADGIVATVNDQIITGFDLRQQMLMLIASSQVQPTEQNLPAIQQASLERLIEQRLKAQEIAKFDTLKVSDQEIDEEIREMARQAGVTSADYLQFLQEGGIQPAAFRENLRTEIGWGQLVPGRFNTRARPSELQIDQEVRRLNDAAAQPQYLVGEIYIEAARVGGQEAAMNGARQLVQQIIQGAPFQAVAQQFSSAPSASARTPGDAGWVVKGT
ncbi:hypothetical protein LTR94_024226, partial [Friedmanniomyces endolithicus]